MMYRHGPRAFSFSIRVPPYRIRFTCECRELGSGLGLGFGIRVMVKS